MAKKKQQKQPSPPQICSLLDADGEDLKYLRDNRCLGHGHRYTSHFNCYIKDRGIEESMVFLDIESGGSLDADWGIVITYAFAGLTGDVTCRKITLRELKDKRLDLDRRLVTQFCRDMKPFNLIVVYYGKDQAGRRSNRHDIPFLRTRAVKHGIPDFPKAGSKRVIDIYDTVKGKFKLSRNSMQNACDTFGVRAKAHPWVPAIWMGAITGHQEDIDYIARHNIEDVLSTRELWKTIHQYKNVKCTI